MWVQRSICKTCIFPDATVKNSHVGDIWSCDRCGKWWKISTYYPEDNPTKAGWLPTERKW